MSPARHSILGTDLQTQRDITISQEARRHGLYIIGVTGTGKSTLITNLILQDVQQGIGVCLIEPHGDLTNAVLGAICQTRPRRLDDVILLDLTDSKLPFGLNLFQCDEPRTNENKSKTASAVAHVFEKIWGVGTTTPRILDVLGALTWTLIDNLGTTFAEIPLLFSDDKVRKYMIANLTNPGVIHFWEEWERWPQRYKDEYIESTMNKVRAFLRDPMVRNIVGQSETTINFRDVVDKGKILLVRLSLQFKDVPLLIGGTLIAKLMLAAYSREDELEEEREQFHLYCDEYQNFATGDFAKFITEIGRKYRVPVTFAHQHLSQLDETSRGAARAAGNMIVFRVSGEDAEALAKEFDTTPPEEEVGTEPERAPVSDVIGHLVRRGHTDPRVTRFSQGYLQALEKFVSEISLHGEYMPHYDLYDFYVLSHDVLRGREALNMTLYRCMIEKSSFFLIDPLALYVMAMAQKDQSHDIFIPFLDLGGWLDFPPHYFRGFKKDEQGGAEAFGHPYFVSMEHEARHAAFAAEQRGRKARERAQAYKAVMTMARELRYTMGILTQSPILVDTGQYVPRKQKRTFADMEKEIARNLTQQEVYQARVKLLSGEYHIQTKNAPRGLPKNEVPLLVGVMKEGMMGLGYCKDDMEVEEEIRERQEDLRRRAGPGKRSPLSEDEPPPTSY